MSNVAFGKPIEEPITNPGAVTDGQVSSYSDQKGFAEFSWPYMLTVDLEDTNELHCIRVLLWDGLGQGNKQRDNRSYKYRLLTSIDHRSWRVIFDGSREGTNGWQVFNFAHALEARYIRVHGIWNSANAYFQIVQVEAHDAAPPELEAEIVLQRTVLAESLEDEIGDGLPLQARVGSIINRIERLVEDNELLNPAPFRQLISQLRNQVADVASLERGMDSIRREIIAPVHHELEQSARLGKFSVWGFWIGLVGGVLAIISLGLSLSQGLVDVQSRSNPVNVPSVSSVNLADIENYNSAPTDFSLNRKQPPLEKSHFTRQDNKWVQQFPDGKVAHYALWGRIVQNGCRGTLIYRLDRVAVEIFVPDKGCRAMDCLVRSDRKGWEVLGGMENVQ